MRKILLTIFGVGIFIFGSVNPGFGATLFGDFLKEQNIEVEVSGSLDFYNQYIWRGFKLDSDPVIQPSFTISAKGFEGGFWGSFDLDQDDGESTNSDEVDGWISYNFDLEFVNEALKIVGISVGNTWYDYPGVDLYTKELYIGLSFDVFLSPYFIWYHDYGDEDQGGADGNYYIIGASHSVNLIEDYGITLDLGQEIGFNNDAFIVGEGGYSLTTLGLTIPLTETLTMAPSVAYSSPFGDLKDESGGNPQDDEFYTGVSLAYDF